MRFSQRQNSCTFTGQLSLHSCSNYFFFFHFSCTCLSCLLAPLSLVLSCGSASLWRFQLSVFCSLGPPYVPSQTTENISFVFKSTASSWGNPVAYMEEDNYKQHPYLPDTFLTLSISYPFSLPSPLVKHSLVLMRPIFPSVNENRKDLCCSQPTSVLLAVTRGC